MMEETDPKSVSFGLNCYASKTITPSVYYPQYIQILISYIIYKTILKDICEMTYYYL